MTEKENVGVIFQNIANLLKVGTFQGQHASLVHDAIVFLENLVAAEKAKQEAAGAEPTPAQ